jgi:hypothetical protein
VPAYRHTQFGWITFAVVFAADAVAIVITVIAGVAWSAFLILGITAVVVALFGWLNTAVENDRVRLWFGIGLVRRSWLLADVVRAEAVRNPLFTGWGIRLLPGRTVYNVSGFEAVEIELRNGKVYRIGTDEPEALLAALADRGVGTGAPAL